MTSLFPNKNLNVSEIMSEFLKLKPLPPRGQACGLDSEKEKENRITHYYYCSIPAKDSLSSALKSSARELEISMAEENKIRHNNDMLTSEMRRSHETASSQAIGIGTIASFAAVVPLTVGLFRMKDICIPVLRALAYKLLKPSLVRETAQFTASSAVRHPIKTFRQLIKMSYAEDVVKGLILKPKLEERLRQIALATRCQQRREEDFSNMVLVGPPGTGKSSFAKSLAKHAGMHYTMLNGNDVRSMGEAAYDEVEDVFTWAEMSRKGTVVFVDEADAFLEKIEEESHSVSDVLDLFFRRTGDPSKKIQLIISSSHLEKIDPDIIDNMDIIVEFEVPGYDERVKLLRYYFQKLILEPAASKTDRIRVVDFDFDKNCAEAAAKTEGLSGEQISKLVALCQAYAVDGLLTEDKFSHVVKLSVLQHEQDLDH